MHASHFSFHKGQKWTRICKIGPESGHLSGVQPSIHLIGSNWALVFTHSVLRSKNRRILTKISLESRNNSSVWHPYEYKELGLARTALISRFEWRNTTFRPIWTFISKHLAQFQLVSLYSSQFTLYKCQTWTHIREIRSKFGHLSEVQPSIHLIGSNWPLISTHLVLRTEKRRILTMIWLESRNNSSVWYPYESEEFWLARPPANIEVSTKEFYFSPNLSYHFRTFNTISAAIVAFVSIFTLYKCQT